MLILLSVIGGFFRSNSLSIFTCLGSQCGFDCACLSDSHSMKKTAKLRAISAYFQKEINGKKVQQYGA